MVSAVFLPWAGSVPPKALAKTERTRDKITESGEILKSIGLLLIVSKHALRTIPRNEDCVGNKNVRSRQRFRRKIESPPLKIMDSDHVQVEIGVNFDQNH